MLKTEKYNNDEYIKIGCTQPGMACRGFFIPCNTCKVSHDCDVVTKEFKRDKIYIRI